MVDRKISPACQYCDGDCCKAINLIIKPGARMRELLGVHYGRDPAEIEVLQIGVKHRCPHLGMNGKCGLWNADPELDKRPAYCQEYLCDKALNPGQMIIEVEG
jgi:Fe-S-cluster containining protein